MVKLVDPAVLDGLVHTVNQPREALAELDQQGLVGWVKQGRQGRDSREGIITEVFRPLCQLQPGGDLGRVTLRGDLLVVHPVHGQIAVELEIGLGLDKYHATYPRGFLEEPLGLHRGPDLEEDTVGRRKEKPLAVDRVSQRLEIVR